MTAGFSNFILTFKLIFKRHEGINEFILLLVWYPVGCNGGVLLSHEVALVDTIVDEADVVTDVAGEVFLDVAADNAIVVAVVVIFVDVVVDVVVVNEHLKLLSLKLFNAEWIGMFLFLRDERLHGIPLDNSFWNDELLSEDEEEEEESILWCDPLGDDSGVAMLSRHCVEFGWWADVAFFDDAGLLVRFLFGESNKCRSPPIAVDLESTPCLGIVMNHSVICFSHNIHLQSWSDCYSGPDARILNSLAQLYSRG